MVFTDRTNTVQVEDPALLRTTEQALFRSEDPALQFVETRLPAASKPDAAHNHHTLYQTTVTKP